MVLSVLLNTEQYVENFLHDEKEIIPGGVVVELPCDSIFEFVTKHKNYYYRDGQLILDTERQNQQNIQDHQTRLRGRREKECFRVINRGQLWYATLTVQQLGDLADWYKAWLDVTDTFIVPEMPDWLKTM